MAPRRDRTALSRKEYFMRERPETRDQRPEFEVLRAVHWRESGVIAEALDEAAEHAGEFAGLGDHGLQSRRKVGNPDARRHARG